MDNDKYNPRDCDFCGVDDGMSRWHSSRCGRCRKFRPQCQKCSNLRKEATCAKCQNNIKIEQVEVIQSNVISARISKSI